MRRRRLEPHYQRQFLDLAIAPDGTAASHPVTVQLKRNDAGHEGRIETVRARYVVGCDGARSGVRRAIGRELVGDFANQAWGVMDVLAVTDFPDIRLKCLIQSAGDGSALIIPREGGYLFRIYIELEKLARSERVASLNVTPERIIAAARRILHPYTLEVKEIAWWSVYEIGQRLCDKFDDVADGEDRIPRVFIAGDACHTHSAKAGQGMNMSMQDTFNLGWKLASVLRGRAAPHLLKTYSQERQPIAKELIDFDHAFSRLISAPPKDPADPASEGVEPAELQRNFVKAGRFTAGMMTRYRPSLLTGEPTHQGLATGFPIGARFHSAPVVRLADARPMQLGHAFRADGRFRLYAFAAAEDPADPSSRLAALCRFLEASPDSPVRKHTPAGADVDSVIDVRAIVQQGHRDLALASMPAFLLPQKGRYGLRDYGKLFCPDLKTGPDIFDLRGVDRAAGAHRRGAARPVCRPRPAARRLRGARRLLRRLHAGLTGAGTQRMRRLCHVRERGHPARHGSERGNLGGCERRGSAPRLWIPPRARPGDCAGTAEKGRPPSLRLCAALKLRRLQALNSS